MSLGEKAETAPRAVGLLQDVVMMKCNELVCGEMIYPHSVLIPIRHCNYRYGSTGTINRVTR